jgi:hypothetical protein
MARKSKKADPLEGITIEQQMLIINKFLKWCIKNIKEARQAYKETCKINKEMYGDDAVVYNAAAGMDLALNETVGNANIVMNKGISEKYYLHLKGEDGEEITKQDFLASLGGQDVIVNDVSDRRQDPTPQTESVEVEKAPIGTQENPISLSPMSTASLKELGIIQEDLNEPENPEDEGYL